MPLRDVLRQSTDEDHRALDAFVGNIWENRAAYSCYISMNHMAHQALEPAIENAVDHFHMLKPYIPVRSALWSDAIALGDAPETALELTEPVRHDLPAAIGAIYVLEGSRLGARMLHARVRAAPWLPESNCKATAFFELAGSTENFNHRMARLGQFVVGDLAVQGAIEGARSAFFVFRKAAERAKTQNHASAIGKVV